MLVQMVEEILDSESQGRQYTYIVTKVFSWKKIVFFLESATLNEVLIMT